jgi:catechol 2,3-dioxygenase-like lactoylglutathione lyase family enzyme
MHTLPFTAIDHVQLAMPVGGEQAAREFYGSLLGMSEIPKPVDLAKRGGAWFTSGAVQIHLGIEADFRPARKAHPALKCSDYHAMLLKLQVAGISIREDRNVPGIERCHIEDPFGNTIELIKS